MQFSEKIPHKIHVAPGRADLVEQDVPGKGTQFFDAEYKGGRVISAKRLGSDLRKLGEYAQPHGSRKIHAVGIDLKPKMVTDTELISLLDTIDIEDEI